MFDHEEPSSGSRPADAHFPESQTDRVNGEYHYKNGFTQKMYSDAHYVPEGETTVPPRYYTPPEKTAKKPISEQTVRVLKLIMMCIMCALLGGLAGGAVINAQISEKVCAMEDIVAAMQEQLQTAERERVLAEEEAMRESPVPASRIYERACAQVVGIETADSPAVFGTGFIISKDGFILTNYHIVKTAHRDDKVINISLYDGDVYEAEFIGADEKGDLAVLKIDAVIDEPATLGDSDALRVGDTIYTVGDPFTGLEYSMSAGHVGALEREIKAEGAAKAISMFQLDAAVNLGNSGGPVYNDRGEIVGIVTAKYSGTGAEGIGFAIPICEAYPRAHEIMTRGYASGRACLSLSVDNRYNSLHSRFYDMPMGAYVLSVDEDGCAARSGILPGDVITALNGETVGGSVELHNVLKHFSSGEAAKIRLYRDGAELELEIVLDEEAP